MNGSFGKGLALAGATLFLYGCGTFPLPKTYILGEQSRPAPGVTDQSGLPRLELKTVTVPDYVDTTDIIRRSASNQVIASKTGRWADRVSSGITYALAADLARRLPNIVIESHGAYEPARRLLVEVEDFDIAEDGRCTLTARWRITSADGKVASNSRQVSFVVAAASATDAGESLAMTSAIDQLAGQIAISVGKQFLG